MTASRSPVTGPPPAGTGSRARPSPLTCRGRARRLLDAVAVMAIPVAGYQWARSTSVVAVMVAGAVFVAAPLWLFRHTVGERG